MRKFSLLLLVALIALVTVLPAAAQDNPEPELSFVSLEPGVPISDVFEGNISANFYAFNGTTGDVVTITMVQEEGSELDPYLVLLGPAGQVIAANDDSSDSKDPVLSSRISQVELPLDGTYLVMSSTFANLEGLNSEPLEAPLSYDVTMTGANSSVPAEDETPFSILGGFVTVGDTLNAASTAAEPVYYFFVDLEEGQNLDVTVTSLTDGFDPIVMLLDPDSRRVAVNDDGGNAASTNPLDAGIAYEVASTGPYIIMVTSTDFENAADPAWENGGDFTLAISAGSGK